MAKGETEKMDIYTNKEAFRDGVKIRSKKIAKYKTGEVLENNRKKLHNLILNIKSPL
jgi:hypothetical protein